MLVRYAAVAALMVLAGCAGVTPVGRNADRAPAPVAAPQAAPVSAPPPAPVQPLQTPAPAPQTAPVLPSTPQAAPPVLPSPPPPSTPAEAQSAPRASRGGGEIIVPGAPERQVPAPAGDPRSMAQRMEDVRAWDQCVTAVQSAFDSDPMRPQLEMPEEYCSRSLGMADRLAVPESRRRR